MSDRDSRRGPQAARASAAALDSAVGFTLGLRYEHLPAPVVDKVKWLLLDGIAAITMGGRREEGQRLLDCTGPAQRSERYTVVGSERTASFTEAALLNTALAQVQDCNDVRRIARRDGGSNHPGRCVVPLGITVGEHARLTGRELIEVLVVGYEVVSRVRTRVQKHGHSSAIAAMVGRALGMSAPELRRALVFAHLGYPLHLLSTSLDDDYLVNGLIASAAVDAARLARAGSDVDPALYTVRLGTRFPEAGAPEAGYAVSDVSIKPYPCCRSLHGAIDLALEIRDEVGVAADDVESIDVRVGNKRDQVFPPAPPDASYKQCQFSVPYAVACAFLDGGVDESSFTYARIASPDVHAFQEKIRVLRDERLQYNPVGIAAFLRPTVVQVTTKDGQTIERSTTSPKGSRFNPLSEDERRRKFNAWAGPSLGPREADDVIETVLRIEDVSDVTDLVSRLRGRAGTR